MGNPTRYFFNGVCRPRPVRDYSAKTIKIVFNEPDEWRGLESVRVEMYQAPDVIMHNRLGISNKDTYRRYYVTTFSDLRVLDVSDDPHDGYLVTFAYDRLDDHVCKGDEMVESVPIGVYHGMTVQDIRERENLYRSGLFKCSTPSSSPTCT